MSLLLRWIRVNWAGPLTLPAAIHEVFTLDIDPTLLPWQTIEVDTTGWPQHIIDAIDVDPFTRRRLTGRR